MAETVTVTPGSGGYDNDGNPLPEGSPVTISTLGVAPGNTMLKLGIGADLDDVAFTVYLELGSPIVDDDTIKVRGKTCRARVSNWVSPWTSRGGMAVLARSVTGSEHELMPKKGFNRDNKAIANILHNDPGGQQAVDEAAARILAQTNDESCFLSEPYHTDRYVRAVMVPAWKQAKHGTGTRAAQSQAT